MTASRHYNPPSSLLPDQLTFHRRSASTNTSSPSPSPSRSSSRSRHAQHQLGSYKTASSSSSTSTLVSQIPLPNKFSTRRRKALDIASHSLSNAPGARVPEWAATPSAKPSAAIVRGRDKVPHLTPSPSPSPHKSSLWADDDTDEVNGELARSKVWQVLMSPASPKGKHRAATSTHSTAIIPTREPSLAAPTIAIVSATYKSQSVLVDEEELSSTSIYYDPGTAAPPNAGPRNKSLSPPRGDSPYSLSSSTSSSSSSSLTSSRSTSPSSSTSTFITDPDTASPPANASVEGTECLSPRCHQARLSTVASFEQLQHAVVSSSSRQAYVRIPYGRDPLTRLVVNCAPSSSPVHVQQQVQVVAAAAKKERTESFGGGKRRLTSFLYTALDVLASVGGIMVDGYSTTPSMEDDEGSYERMPAPRVERDSLGLEKATLSPTGGSPSALFGETVNVAATTTASPCTPAGRPRQARRRSLRHVSSDPILYHHHARAPSIQRRKQAFGPHDVKPYGYRVGPEQVAAAFKEVAHVSEESGKTETTVASVWDYAFFPTAMLLEGEMIVDASGSRTPFVGSAVPSRQGSSQRPPSPPASAIVALQRYPIIPYNPPGAGVAAEEEVFPKIRDQSQGKLWYLDLVPGGGDGLVDAEVPLSTDEATLLFKSFPAMGETHYGLKAVTQCTTIPPRRRGSSREGRGRSPSPQRGRARNIRPVRPIPNSASASPVPAKLSNPSSARTKALAQSLTSRTLSAKHFRSPSLQSSSPSTYLLWALKGSTETSLHQQRKRKASSVVVGGKEGRCAVANGVDGLKGSARRRVGGDGRVRSALRWEVVVWNEEDDSSSASEGI